jgi:hypothetical protein
MNYSNCKMVKGAQFIHGNYTGEAYTYAHWQAVKSGRSYGGTLLFVRHFLADSGLGRTNN